MPPFLAPLRRSYTYLQNVAHEQPAIFYSIIVGAVGPVLVLVVPEVRKSFFGWTPIERPPTTYPGQFDPFVSLRPRRSLMLFFVSFLHLAVRFRLRLWHISKTTEPLAFTPTPVPNRPRDAALAGFEDA
ncbi:hypothetical protein P7C70_g4783, partial [Phenoliferia sp. Uapishka_3]